MPPKELLISNQARLSTTAIIRKTKNPEINSGFIVINEPGSHVRAADMRQSAGELDIELGSDNVSMSVFLE